MAGDPGGRRLLPQNNQWSFTFAPNNFGPRENQKSAHSHSPVYSSCLRNSEADHCFRLRLRG